MDTYLYIDITFFQGENKYYLEDQIIVNHFHNLKFKILLGNILNDSRNYINMRIVQFSLLPCMSLML